jgi:hypothetical protein
LGNPNIGIEQAFAVMKQATKMQTTDQAIARSRQKTPVAAPSDIVNGLKAYCRTVCARCQIPRSGQSPIGKPL